MNDKELESLKIRKSNYLSEIGPKPNDLGTKNSL